MYKKSSFSATRNFLFTLFTPVYNGEKTLYRVFDSLKKTHYRNFEWIVINDGSTDSSHDLIQEFVKSVDWDITYINEHENKGKHVAWNHAAQIAKGEIFITIDCDDAFLPEALDFLNAKWNEHFDDKSIYGIDTLCKDPENGETCGTPFPYDGIISSYDELFNKYKVRGDKWNSFRTEYMKLYPFPEITCNYYTECFLLYSLGEKFKCVGYNTVLRLYYQEPNSLMHVRSIKVNDMYMIMHYQSWHLRRMGLHLLIANPREFLRCSWELCKVSFLYWMMRKLRAKEIVRK